MIVPPLFVVGKSRSQGATDQHSQSPAKLSPSRLVEPRPHLGERHGRRFWRQGRLPVLLARGGTLNMTSLLASCLTGKNC